MAPLAVGAVLLALGTSAIAQVGHLWTFDALLREADVVIVGACITTEDTGRRREHPYLSPGSPVQELQSSFRVAAVLKHAGGPAVEHEVRVRHYRYTADALEGGLVNAGSWLRPRAGHSYLLFLRRGADGSWERLSGHAFPAESAYHLDEADGRR